MQLQLALAVECGLWSPSATPNHHPWPLPRRGGGAVCDVLYNSLHNNEFHVTNEEWRSFPQKEIFGRPKRKVLVLKRKYRGSCNLGKRKNRIITTQFT